MFKYSYERDYAMTPACAILSCYDMLLRKWEVYQIDLQVGWSILINHGNQSDNE